MYILLWSTEELFHFCVCVFQNLLRKIFIFRFCQHEEITIWRLDNIRLCFVSTKMMLNFQVMSLLLSCWSASSAQLHFVSTPWNEPPFFMSHLFCLHTEQWKVTRLASTAFIGEDLGWIPSCKRKIKLNGLRIG